MKQNYLIPGLPDDVAAECLVRVSYNSLTVVASVCQRWREEVGSPDFFHRRTLAGVAKSFLVLYLRDVLPRNIDNPPDSGFIVMFDPSSREWQRLPPIPTVPQYSCIEYKIFAAGRRIVAVGFLSPHEIVPLVHIFDLSTGRWRSAAPCPIPKLKALNACASDGIRKVFIAGGVTRYCIILRSTLAYDVDEDKWERLPDMAEERVTTAQGLFHDGIFYVVGGRQRYPVPKVHKSAALLHASTGEWSLEQECFLPFLGRVVFGPDGNRYQFFLNGHKLMVKEGSDWRFVCNLPSELIGWAYYCLFAWKGGFVLGGTHKAGVYQHWDNIYMLALHRESAGEEATSLSCHAMQMPRELGQGSILCGCSIEI